MKKIIIALILCALALTACSREGAQSETGSGDTTASAASSARVTDYFPFNKDVHMKYRGEGNEFAEYETYVDYVGDGVMQLRNSNGGTTAAIVYKIENGTLKRVFLQGEAYYRHDFTDSVNQDEVLIMEPIKAGTAWKLSDGSDRSITSVDLQLSTPAGEFKALEITTKRQDSVQKDYYAKDTGLVKTVFISGEDESAGITSEIEKIEKDVPLKQTVRFYYPQFDKDRVVYIDREIELFTNDDILKKLESGLKTVPEGSGLSKVLSPGAGILGVGIDEEKGTVTVDFTPELITEMNAGTSLEGMLVKSIANTFGDYYLKDRVIVTTGGKLYESGHIQLLEGDYFSVDRENTTEYR